MRVFAFVLLTSLAAEIPLHTQGDVPVVTLADPSRTDPTEFRWVMVNGRDQWSVLVDRETASVLWCGERHRPGLKYDGRGLPLLDYDKACITLQQTMVAAKPADDGKPRLTLRASPPLPLTNKDVVLVAELLGREDERFYCPAVRWRLPDGTEATEESDCPPWTERGGGYRRRWSRMVRFGTGGSYEFEVRLEKAGKTLMRQALVVEVHG